MSSYVTNDIWEKNIKKYNYDSFVDVLTMGKSPLVLVASPKSDVNTPEQFIRLIRTSTSPINVAVGGGALQLQAATEIGGQLTGQLLAHGAVIHQQHRETLADGLEAEQSP